MKRPIKFLNTILAVLLWMAGSSMAWAAQPAFFYTHHDTIPNFAQFPTIITAQHGSWTNPATWSPSRLPNSNDIVLITHTVTYNSTSGHVDTIGIDAGGKLQFITNQSTALMAATLQVMPNGTLEIGTESHPIQPTVQAEIIIKNKPLDLLDDGSGVFDPYQFGTGIVVIDGTLKFHGTPKALSFVRLNREPRAGDMTLYLEQPVSGWKTGDRLIIPDTRLLQGSDLGNNYAPQWEELVLDNISADGKTVQLTMPLNYNHLGAYSADGELRFLPHIGNLSRNIIVKSETPQGTRGHTLFTHRANIDIRYVQFQHLGRTTIQTLNNTTADAQGNITKIGTNQIGRYPVHAHHLIGPRSSSATNQFTLLGNAVDGGSHQHSFKAGITVHDSHYGLIKQNVVYNTAGAGIATETGSESFNVFERNFVVRVFGPGGRADLPIPFGQGTGFWMRSVNDIIRQNVAANVSPMLDTYGYVIFNQYVGNQKIPAYKGADPKTDGTTTNMYSLPLREFTGNEAYGALDGGMTIWWVGTFGNTPQNASPSHIKDLHVWHTHRRGFWNYPVSNVVIDGLTVLGDRTNPMGIGINMTDYLTDRVTIRNADIQGMRIGIDAPVRFTAENSNFVVENSFFQNRMNVQIDFLWNCCIVNLHSRIITLRNVKFSQLGTFPLQTIFMRWLPEHEVPFRIADLIELSRVYIENYNQNPGKNFQVFFKEQAPDALVHQTSGNLRGSPEAGLSNQSNWNQYRIANGGEMAPCLDDTSYPEIHGLVCPTNATADPGETTPLSPPTGLRVTIIQ